MSQVNACLVVINQAAKGFMPQVGMVLGSGLGSFADQIDAIASISFVIYQVFLKQEWVATQDA